MSDSKLIHEMHQCLVGNKLSGQKGLIDKVDSMDTKMCVMQNQVNTLMQDREKNKGKVTITVPKWLSALVGLKVKTGI